MRFAPLVLCALAAAAPGEPGLGVVPPAEHFWINAEDWQRRRARLLESELAGLIENTTAALRETTGLDSKGLADLPPARWREPLNRLDTLTTRYACLRDQHSAAEALTWTEACLDAAWRSELGKAAAGLSCSVAFAFCRDAWGEEATRRVSDKLFRHGLKTIEIGRGNPDNPFNNWWGVTHSGAGLCFLMASAHRPEAVAMLRREQEKVASYLLNYGDSGHYYEGTGYGLYSQSMWGPFVLACRAAEGIDVARHAPNACLGSIRLHTLSAPARPRNREGRSDPPLGLRVSWNDDSSSFPSAHLVSLGLRLAPESERPALLAAFDRYCGRNGDGSWLKIGVGHGHPMWTLLYYPLDVDPPEYGVGLPLTSLDQKNGLALFRDRYRDGDDTIFAVNAKAYHGGGHNHDDAGSFRLLGLGVYWAQGGGQAKPQARYQNVLLRDGQQPAVLRHESPRTGKVSYFADREAGGVASLDLSSVYDVERVRRHTAVRFGPDEGVAAIVAVCDEIVDASGRGSDWAWSMCYDRRLSVSIEESEGFTLADKSSGASLQVRFAAPHELAMSDNLGPPSQRTFSNGTVRDYPGARYVVASAGRQTRYRFFTIMTLQSDRLAPEVRFVEQDGLTHALVGEEWRVSLDRSRWFNGPLRIERLVERSGSEPMPTWAGP